MKTQFNERELATVLAALRCFQDCASDAIDVTAYPHFDGVDPLTTKEIDELCERLNTDAGRKS
jgi:hypothetical protein